MVNYVDFCESAGMYFTHSSGGCHVARFYAC